MTGKGRRARAGSRAGPRAGPGPAPAGNTDRHLQNEHADDRERHHSAQDILGHVPRWPAGLAQAADRSQIPGQLPELPALPAGRSASWSHTPVDSPPPLAGTSLPVPHREALAAKDRSQGHRQVAIPVAVQRRATQSSQDRPRMLVQPEPIRTAATRAANAVGW